MSENFAIGLLLIILAAVMLVVGYTVGSFTEFNRFDKYFHDRLVKEGYGSYQFNTNGMTNVYIRN